jgi:mono/diheme cytochrome c family protein
MPGADKKPRLVQSIIVILGFAIALPLISEHFAQSAVSDTAPNAAAAPAVSDTAPDNMPGWRIPDPVNPPSDPQAASVLARGKYLVTVGDCLPCHSVEGEPAFSGGRSVDSPVGAVFSPNISSDKKYGIGSYTDGQFWKVMHNGIAPGSSLLVFPKYLYPSMPYDAYSKLSYPDVMAIKAYLMSLPASPTPDRASQIPFPFNIRAALLGWRILFFRPEPINYDPSWSPSVRNGAFLVQALGHCSDCHTPRNILFASEYDKFLSGGHILAQSWWAPDITSSAANGVGNWPTDKLVNYLHDGGSLGAGAPFGPMQETVFDSLSRLPTSDIQDIAAYLQTGTKPLDGTAPVAAATPDINAGAQIYADNCARCHGGNGEGVDNNFPNLAGNQAVVSGPSYDVISMVLGGYTSWHENQSTMPSFRSVLTDAQIADVTNYVRTAWGNKGVPDATGDKVASLIGDGDTVIGLDTGSVKAAVLNGNNAMSFDTISGQLILEENGLDCRLDSHFANSDPTQSTGNIDLAGTCTHGGSGLKGFITMNGQTTPASFLLVQEKTDNYLDDVIISGKIPNTSDSFRAKIKVVTPND